MAKSTATPANKGAANAAEKAEANTAATAAGDFVLTPEGKKVIEAIVDDRMKSAAAAVSEASITDQKLWNSILSKEDDAMFITSGVKRLVTAATILGGMCANPQLSFAHDVHPKLAIQIADNLIAALAEEQGQ